MYTDFFKKRIADSEELENLEELNLEDAKEEEEEVKEEEEKGQEIDLQAIFNELQEIKKSIEELKNNQIEDSAMDRLRKKIELRKEIRK